MKNIRHRFIAALSYLLILVFVPLFYKKRDSFIKYHIKSGLNMFLIWISYFVAFYILSFIKIKGECLFNEEYLISNYCETTPNFIIYPMIVIGSFLLLLTLEGVVLALSGKKSETHYIGRIKIIK